MDYYYMQDLNLVGKIENFVPYIYDKEKGWIVDNKNILMDRVIGYDGESIGSNETLKIEEITEDKANEIIKNI